MYDSRRNSCNSGASGTGHSNELKTDVLEKRGYRQLGLCGLRADALPGFQLAVGDEWLGTRRPAGEGGCEPHPSPTATWDYAGEPWQK